MNRAGSCTFVQSFHVGPQNAIFDLPFYKIYSRNLSIDILDLINVYRYELKHLFLELHSRDKKSICEDYFCVYFDELQVDNDL